MILYFMSALTSTVMSCESESCCHFLLFAQGQKGEPGDVPVVSVSYI